MFFHDLRGNTTIWCISTPSDICLAQAVTRLPTHEQQRSASFKNTRHGNWWAYVHLVMRNILGKYIGCDGSDLTFQYSSNNKPSLALVHEPKLFFNLTHCSDIALLAVNDCGELGVDVENIKRLSDMRLVVKHFFSKAEQQYFAQLHGDKKVDVFYEIWTQKESVIKANGGGLSLPLDAFDVVGTTTKNWTSIQPRGDQFGLTEYATRALCLSELGLAKTHKAAISVDKKTIKGIPSIKMQHYLPEHF